MNAATTAERGTLSALEAALDRVPEEHEEKRGRRTDHDLEDWIVAEDRRLRKQLLRAMQLAGA